MIIHEQFQLNSVVGHFLPTSSRRVTVLLNTSCRGNKQQSSAPTIIRDIAIIFLYIDWVSNVCATLESSHYNNNF